MEFYVVTDPDMRKMILADAPKEVQMEHDNPNREWEGVDKGEMIRRRSGVLFWADWSDAYTLKIPSARIQYFFKCKSPDHYLGLLKAEREAKEIKRSMAKPKGKDKGPITT